MKNFRPILLAAAVTLFWSPLGEAGEPNVVPFVFDPYGTNLVAGHWLEGTGCPTNATVVAGGAASTFTDDACPTGDLKDKKNEGLVLFKTGPTQNFAASGAVIQGVKGITLSELGYDVRNVSGAPLHCGAGAPRFNVVTSDGVTHFVGCASPPPSSSASSQGWTRLRWDAAALAGAFPPIKSTDTVESIAIVFDEGQDTGPDFSGLVVLDNININGQLIGRGATGR